MNHELKDRFHPSVIDASNVDFYLENSRPMDVPGIDSLPYRVGDWMVQRYFNLPLEQVLFYQQMTNQMALCANTYSTDVPGYGNVQLEVERILKILQSEKTGSIYGISRYVTGIKVPQNRLPKLTGLLELFTVDMEQKFALKGVSIITANTRLKQGFFPFSGSKCNITDICTSIKELRKA